MAHPLAVGRDADRGGRCTSREASRSWPASTAQDSRSAEDARVEKEPMLRWPDHGLRCQLACGVGGAAAGPKASRRTGRPSLRDQPARERLSRHPASHSVDTLPQSGLSQLVELRTFGVGCSAVMCTACLLPVNHPPHSPICCSALGYYCAQRNQLGVAVSRNRARHDVGGRSSHAAPS